MKRVKQIEEDILNGQIRPIYFLMGEESFYIDRITQIIENKILKEEEKSFNQLILYGRDVSIEEIVSNAKRYPLMAERQVIIIKEAQDLARTIENLSDYAENPVPSTVLVICYKYKTLDKRKKLAKVIAKKGCLFESNKLYENQVPEWINYVLKEKNYRIQPKAALMLVDYLGNDLSRVYNELEKLMLIVPKETSINEEHIEDNIGISKDFNNFELRKALGEKNLMKVYQIAYHFSQNAKNNPLVVTISLLNNFFTQLLIYHGLHDKSRTNVGKSLGINPYFVQEYTEAANNYPMRKVSAIIGFLREADLKSKGVGANNIGQGDILKELIYKILH